MNTPVPPVPTDRDRERSNAFALDRAQRDKASIAILGNTPAFTDYFLRRLQEKRDATAKRLVEEKLPEAETVRLRLLWDEYGELLTMHRSDHTNAESTIRQLSRPQVG